MSPFHSHPKPCVPKVLTNHDLQPCGAYEPMYRRLTATSHVQQQQGSPHDNVSRIQTISLGSSKSGLGLNT